MSGRRRNSVISAEKRHNLIKLVQEEGFSILRAGKKLGIKCSTAKQIVKRYKQTGRFFMKTKSTQKTTTDCSTSLTIGENSQGCQQVHTPYYCYLPQQIPEYPICYYMPPILCYYV